MKRCLFWCGRPYGFDNIHAPRSKRPRWTYHVKLVDWNLYKISMPLTLMTLCTYHMLSLSMVIQKYPALKIFFAKVNPFMWGPHVPACISSKTLSLVTSTHCKNPKFEVLLYRISSLRKKWLAILLKVCFCLLVAFSGYSRAFINLLMS